MQALKIGCANKGKKSNSQAELKVWAREFKNLLNGMSLYGSTNHKEITTSCSDNP